jgi:hypothetical protein
MGGLCLSGRCRRDWAAGSRSGEANVLIVIYITKIVNISLYIWLK